MVFSFPFDVHQYHQILSLWMSKQSIQGTEVNTGQVYFTVNKYLNSCQRWDN